MNIGQFLWRRVIRPMGLYWLSHTGQFDLTQRRLWRLRRCGLQIHWAVDGGAAKGDWTDRLKRVYTDCQVLCIEPRQEVQASLQSLAKNRDGIRVIQAALGEFEGQTIFSELGEQSSILPNSRGKRFGKVGEIPVSTLDRLCDREAIPNPDLIKLDLQGAELACLRGAPRCLAHAQAVILETCFLPLYQDAPLVVDALQFMHDRGFRCYDILSLFQRPLDGALAFGDLLFLREGHQLLHDTRWSSRAAWETDTEPG